MPPMSGTTEKEEQMLLVKQVPAGKGGKRYCGVLALCFAMSLMCQTALAQEVALDLKDALRDELKAQIRE